MKPYSLPELKTFIMFAEGLLIGGQLQECLSNEQGIALGLQNKGEHFWLIFDLQPAAPLVLLFQNSCPFANVHKGKPVSLFIRSHGKNLFLQSIKLEEQQGRVFQMDFRNQNKNCLIEARLIPKQANLFVHADGKCISWDKPKELSSAPLLDQYPEPRSIEEIHQQWLKRQGQAKGAGLDPQSQWEKKRQRDLEKKKKAMLEIEKQLNENQNERWSEVGENLKSLGPLALDSMSVSDQAYYDFRKSYSWNLENAFARAKQLTAKRSGSMQRLEKLKEEIHELENSVFSQSVNKGSKSGKTNKDLMQSAKAKGRTLRLASGAVAYCGKSASDNLAILRAARAWDYWLHLRDYPGAHAIIHREKHQELSTEELKKVATWLARESLSQKSLQLGQRLNVIWVECRFVRPIKGDKLGRVNYHSEKNFVCQLDT